MTSASDRREIIALLDEAMAAGARQASACAELALDRRTVQRWRASDGAVREDLRPVTHRPPPIVRKVAPAWASYHSAGGVNFGRRLTALGIAAKIIHLYGYTYWPIFERLDTELTERNQRRSRVMARLSQSRPARGKTAKDPRPARRLNAEGIEYSHGN
jgi:hypothetical protein